MKGRGMIAGRAGETPYPPFFQGTDPHPGPVPLGPSIARDMELSQT